MATYMDGFIEIDYADDVPPFSDGDQIHSLTEGSFVLKDYTVFNALAGGREAFMAAEDKDPTSTPKFPPRGIPVPQSTHVAQHYFQLVADPKCPPDPYFWPQHRCITPCQAQKWLKEDGCFHSTVVQSINCCNFNADDYAPTDHLAPTVAEYGHIHWHVVAEPCFRNATWLLLKEFDQSLEHHGLHLDMIPFEYSIIRNAMTAIAVKRSAERVRLVIWFS